MIGDKIVCEREGCEEEFTKRTHNQKYHNAECTRLATNVNIMVKYHSRRAQLLGQARYCASCGVTRLSRYNLDDVCNSCTQQAAVERNLSVSNMLASVDWAV